MININDVIDEMVEVKLVDCDEGFQKVVETLTRVGVASNTKKTLSQTTHILHKRGRYYICHFKELFALDGKRTDLTEDDLSRRNRIVLMLTEWGLVTPVDNKHLQNLCHPTSVRVIKHSEKHNWNLIPKYTMKPKKK